MTFLTKSFTEILRDIYTLKITLTFQNIRDIKANSSYFEMYGIYTIL